MHKFLRSIGFAGIATKPQEINLLTAMEYASRCGAADEKKEAPYATLNCEVAENMGVLLCGYRDGDGRFVREYYYPYLLGDIITPIEDSYVRRHSDNESYAVLCEEYRMGASLIFHMTNGDEFHVRAENHGDTEITGGYLTGLAVSGSIILPIYKTEKQEEMIRSRSLAHSRKIEAAREGDEEAIQSLTMEELSLYGEVSQRMTKEDLYSIVDSCFMPSGVECDSYMVVGEILDCGELTNAWTGENVWKLCLKCNGQDITVGINETDLLGEPKIGRRFKGDVWLQGFVTFGSGEKSREE